MLEKGKAKLWIKKSEQHATHAVSEIHSWCEMEAGKEIPKKRTFQMGGKWTNVLHRLVQKKGSNFTHSWNSMAIGATTLYTYIP